MKIRNFKVILNAYSKEITMSILSYFNNDEGTLSNADVVKYINTIDGFKILKDLGYNTDDIHEFIFSADLAGKKYSSLCEMNELSYLRILLDKEGLLHIHEFEITDEILESYLIHLITVGLLDYNINQDTVMLSDTGKEVAEVNKRYKDTEPYLFYNKYNEALFRNQTNIDYLHVLYKANKPLSQFEISYELFRNNDVDYDSLTVNKLKKELLNKIETEKLKKDYIKEVVEELELNADKYVRTISNWFIITGLVNETNKKIDIGNNINIEIPAYELTDKATNFLISEKYHPANKIDLPNLHVNKMYPNKIDEEYIYMEIFKLIEKHKNILGIDEIHKQLESKGIIFNKNKIKEFVDDFTKKNIFYYDIKTRHKSTSQSTKDLINRYAMKSPDLTSKVIYELKKLGINENLKLIDYSFNSEYSKEFESFTCDLLKYEANLNAQPIDKIPGPDSIIEEGITGVIIDNKSSDKKFSLTKNYRDQMNSYLTHAKLKDDSLAEWWKEFNDDIQEYQFLFVTNGVTKNVSKQAEQLTTISNNKGAVLSAKNLLIYLDGVKKNKFDKLELINKINNNETILEFK